MEDEIMKSIFVDPAMPATPSVGNVIVYVKTDGKFYSKDHTGMERIFTEEAQVLLKKAFPLK